MKMGDLMETTFGIIKPDAVEAYHIGEIISMIERRVSFEIVAMRMHVITREEAHQLYAEHTGKFFFEDLVAFITDGPSVLLAIEGERAVAGWRTLMGATDAKQADAGTIRAQFGSFNSETMYRNCVHGSDSLEAAKRELGLFFSDNTFVTPVEPR